MANTFKENIKRIEEGVERSLDDFLWAVDAGVIDADDTLEEHVFLRYVDVVDETDKALYVEIRHPDDKNYTGEKRYATVFSWFPKSWSRLHKEDQTIEIPRWLLKDKKLEEYQYDTAL